jgi:hypothetical protein
MFSLSECDLEKKLLGCGDGPACFNAELSKKDGRVISVDPIYEFNIAEIQSRIDEVYPQIMDQVSKNKNDYVWKNIINVEELGKTRMKAMNIFLKDYEEGKKSGRYIASSLPTLPFEDNAFDLALCSHYLFLYSQQVSLAQHLLSMKELCRVAREVRVYPLLSISNNKQSPHLEPVIAALTESGVSISLVPVEYEFQKGATKMLVAMCA